VSSVPGAPGLRLDADLTDLPLVIGPTEHRPLDRWLGDAVELMMQTFEVEPADLQVRNYLTRMLERIGRPDDGLLPYRLIRWLDFRDLPLVASFGMVDRAGAEELEAYLEFADSAPVEKPIVEVVDGRSQNVVRRALGYGQHAEALGVEVRYLIDTGHPGAVVLLEAGTREPGALVAATEDLDAFADRVTVEGAAG